MKNQTDINIIKQEIDDYRKSIREAQAAIDHFEGLKSSDAQNVNAYNQAITERRNLIEQAKKKIAELTKQLSDC